MTSSRRARSVTVRAIGPSDVWSAGQPSHMPVRLTKPAEGCMPTRLFHVDGRRMEAEPSSPTPTVAKFDARPAPVPPDEPPGVRSSAYGFLDRTPGGSSGGTGAGLASNFATVGVGEEGSASIRRPSTWNSLVGMHPSAGFVSRTGMWDGWPALHTSLGPMARTVTDLARLLEVMVGYDPEDPLTAAPYGSIPPNFTSFLDKNGLKGARLGIVREAIGGGDPNSDDFKKVGEVFNKAIEELKAAGAELVDPIVIPNARALMAKRTEGPYLDEAARFYLKSPNAPFHTRQDIARQPGYDKVLMRGKTIVEPIDERKYYEHLQAREELMFNVLKVMADSRVDAIGYKSIELQPQLLSRGPDAPNPGVPTMSTFLAFVPTITVPAGFTGDGLPTGITFQGRPYSDGT